MAKPSRLHKRGNRYYVRARVPLDLVPALGKREIIYSLDTSDYREAVRAVRIESVKIDEQFATARRQQAPDVTRKVSRHELERLSLIWFQNFSQRQKLGDASGFTALEQLEEALIDLDIDEADALDPSSSNTLPFLQREVDNLLSDHHLTIDRKSETYWELIGLLRRGYLERLRRERLRMQGSYESKSYDSLFPLEASRSDAPLRPKSKLTVADLIEQFQKDPQRREHSSKKLLEYRVVFRLMNEVLGPNTEVSSIHRAQCREIRDILQRLPANAGKRFPNRTLIQAADESGGGEFKRLTPSTINSYLSKLSTILRWALREEYIERNPAEGLRVADTGPHASQKRHPFSTDQLKLIFNAPLYTGCKDDQAGYATKGNKIVRGSRFWIPLIALYSGLRLNEICQLEVADIVIEGSVPLFSVSDAQLETAPRSSVPGDTEDRGVVAKRLKTRSANRKVPVHTFLLSAGFEEYVSNRRQAGERRLFPDLRPDKRGYLSDSFQKWFSRFLIKAGAQRQRTSFHSFRHNFRDALRAASTPTDLARYLGGWSDSNTSELYGHGFPAVRLAEGIARIEYGGLAGC